MLRQTQKQAERATVALVIIMTLTIAMLHVDFQSAVRTLEGIPVGPAKVAKVDTTKEQNMQPDR